MAQHGSIIWTELNTRDVEGAKQFYAETLGWTYSHTPMPQGTYTLVQSGGGPVMAGIFDINSPEFAGMPEHWFTYIAVDDVDARVGKVEAAGGRVIRPPFDVPGVGRIAIVKDKGGAVCGWMKSVDA